jgi:N-hydroxyarylamine O-acetyltransferase
MLTPEQLKQYLDLISFEYASLEELTPNLELLKTLHEKHVFLIPFENLSIHFKEHVEIDTQWILDKFSRQPQRGGYCHEMNGLFYEVLKSLGFDVQLHLSDVIIAHDKFREIPEPAHSMLIVCIEHKQYLVDVGFGLNGLIHPLLLNDVDIQQVYQTQFQIIPQDQGFVFGVHYEGQFHPEYRFDLHNPLTDIKLLQPHSNKASYEDEVFMALTLISKPTQTGRTTLSYSQLRTVSAMGTSKEPIPNIEVFYAKLRENFHMEFSPSEKALFESKMAAIKPPSSFTDSNSEHKVRSPLQVHSHFSRSERSDNFTGSQLGLTTLPGLTS